LALLCGFSEGPDAAAAIAWKHFNLSRHKGFHRPVNLLTRGSVSWMNLAIADSLCQGRHYEERSRLGWNLAECYIRIGEMVGIRRSADRGNVGAVVVFLHQQEGKSRSILHENRERPRQRRVSQDKDLLKALMSGLKPVSRTSDEDTDEDITRRAVRRIKDLLISGKTLRPRRGR